MQFLNQQLKSKSMTAVYWLYWLYWLYWWGVESTAATNQLETCSRIERFSRHLHRLFCLIVQRLNMLTKIMNSNASFSVPLSPAHLIHLSPLTLLNLKEPRCHFCLLANNMSTSCCVLRRATNRAAE